MEMEQENQKRPAKFKDEAVVKLDYPVEWGEDIITEICIKRPRGKHIKNLGDGVKLNDLLKIASKCSGTSMGVFEEMASPDVMKVADAVGDLL